MNIFKIFFLKREIQKGLNNPSDFVSEQLFSSFQGLFILLSLIPLIFIIFFGVLGLTSWLGGPYGFFKVIFWLFFIPYLFLEFFIISIFLKIKKIAKKRIKKTIIEIKAIEL